MTVTYFNGPGRNVTKSSDRIGNSVLACDFQRFVKETLPEGIFTLIMIISQEIYIYNIYSIYIYKVQSQRGHHELS